MKQHDGFIKNSDVNVLLAGGGHKPLSEFFSMPNTGIGSATKPIYWNGSQFVAANDYPTTSSQNYDNVYVKKTGDTMTGPLGLTFGQHIVIGTQNNNTSSTTSYISAGSGYSPNSGRYGVKVLSCDQTDCQSGIGQDLSGKPYDMCVAACSGNVGYSYISFVSHPVNSTTYYTMGYFTWNGSSSLTVNGPCYTSSDIIKKKNVKSISNLLPLYEFDWKDNNKHSYGFIAQELEYIGHFELVNENEFKYVDYNAALSYFLAKLSNIVEDNNINTNNRINLLEKRILDLELENQDLRKRLNN